MSRLGSVDVRAAIWLVAALAGLTLLVGQIAQGKAVKGQDASLARIEKALAQSNVKVRTLNRHLDHLQSIDTQLGTLTRRTVAIGAGVGRSAALTARTDRSTGGLLSAVGGVNAATGRIHGRLGDLAGQTDLLAGQVAELKGTVDPLAADTRAVRVSVEGMNGSLGRMNGSLRYVIRVLDYLAAPPFGGPFSVRVTLDKAALPNIPDITVETSPIPVFRAGAWAPYRGR